MRAGWAQAKAAWAGRWAGVKERWAGLATPPREGGLLQRRPATAGAAAATAQQVLEGSSRLKSE